jgi:hypothetical protein
VLAKFTNSFYISSATKLEKAWKARIAFNPQLVQQIGTLNFHLAMIIYCRASLHEIYPIKGSKNSFTSTTALFMIKEKSESLAQTKATLPSRYCPVVDIWVGDLKCRRYVVDWLAARI